MARGVSGDDMFDTIHLNFSAFVLSGIFASLLGLVWYHPKVLGRQWVESQGIKMQGSPLPYIVSFFLWMLSACFYAFLAQFLKINTPEGYFCLSCLLWVAFAMPPTLMSALYTGRSFEAMAIDAAYQLGGYYTFAAVHITFLHLNIA